MTLTEQWKAGKLEEYKKYYCKTKWFEDIFQARCYNKGAEDEWWVLKNEKYSYNNIYHTKDIEVLAPVPSYEEWTRNKDSLDDYKRLCDMRGKIIDKMDESNEDTVKHLRQENAQLHKFLEEFNALDVAKENQQLKELLKECREIFSRTAYTHKFDMVVKIDNAIGEKK